MTRRLTALFFLLVFLFNATGYYLIFKVQQHQVREKVKLKLIRSVSENELTVVSFDPNSEEFEKIDWIEGHEFRYKGRMYDISRQETDVNGIIHYHCINDTQEEELFADLDQHIKDHVAANTPVNSGGEDEVQKIEKDYFFETLPFNLLFDKINSPFFLKILSPDSIVADVAVPPPDKV